MPTCPTCHGRFDDATFCPRDGARLLDDTGRVLGDRYRLIRKVGEGAMGEVFEAMHVHINRRVAVKLLQRKLATDVEARRRLQREAQSTSDIEHPNVVESLDFGFTEDGQPYLVMEWLDGETLDQRMQSGLLDLDTALEIASQMAAGLAEAHERGVVHRDLKPANIFLVRDRKGHLVVKVLDFGIAKLHVQDAKLTGTGVVIGTPIYMAPEQAFGENVDARTDIYAMGVILFEMLTGSVPFSADTPLVVLHQHASKRPPPPSSRAPERGIKAALDALVARCLEKKPDDRFQTMHELAAAIAAARTRVAAPAVQTRSTPVPTTRHIPDPEPDADDSLVPAPRRRGGLLVAFVILGALGTGAAVFAILRWQGRSEASSDASIVATAADAGAADASPIATARDAGATDAATPAADARVDVVDVIKLDGRGKDFAFDVTLSPSKPQPDRPLQLTFAVREPSQRIRDALARDKVEARLALQYFRDHSTVHTSTHRLDRDGTFTVSFSLAKIAKHHARVELFIDGKEIDGGRFDLFAR